MPSSMAAAKSFLSSSPCIPRKTGLRSGFLITCCLLKNDATHAHVSKDGVLSITSTSPNKVYEDQMRGIVCYRDKNGELVCEGYDDEGERSCASCPTIHPRDENTTGLKLLETSWIQLARESRCTSSSEYSAGDFLN